MKTVINSAYKNRKFIALAFLLLIVVLTGTFLATSCDENEASFEASQSHGVENGNEPNLGSLENSDESFTDASESESESSLEDTIIPELGTYEEDIEMIEEDDIIFLDVKFYNDKSPTFNMTDGTKYLDDIATLLKRYAPEDMLISAACAIAYTEGGAGKSGVYTVTNNCFGLRAASTWDGYVFARSTGRVYKDYKTAVAYQAYDLFRAYDSMEESVIDFINVIENNYNGALKSKTSKAFFKYLLARGYGNKDIFSTWMYLINLYDLTQYDMPQTKS